MHTMGVLQAVVRGGRAVLVDDRVDYPDGTELVLEIRGLEASALTELEVDQDAAERARALARQGAAPRVAEGAPAK